MFGLSFWFSASRGSGMAEKEENTYAQEVVCLVAERTDGIDKQRNLLASTHVCKSQWRPAFKVG